MFPNISFPLMKDRTIRTCAAQLLALVVVAVMMLLSSCVSPQDVPGAIRVKGVVRHIDLEGGCWVIEVGDNVRAKTFYELTGEDLKDVAFNDAIITVWIVPKPDVASVCQVGQVAEIIDVVDVEKPRE